MGRGHYHGKKDGSQYHEYPRRDRSPHEWQNNQGDYQYDYHYSQRTPVHTYSRFSPLRDEYSREPYNSHYSHMDREHDQYNRSPFNYNQTYPRPSQAGGFPRETKGYNRGPEQSVSLEGGSMPGKRKRIKDEGIFHLSHATFTDAEKLTLDKGLKKKLNKFATFIGAQKVIRKLNIQRHFIINSTKPSHTDERRGTVHSGLANPSLFNPPGPIAPSINVFWDLVLKDLDHLPKKNT